MEVFLKNLFYLLYVRNPSGVHNPPTWYACAIEGVGEGHATLRHPVPLQEGVARQPRPPLHDWLRQGSGPTHHQPIIEKHSLIS